MLLSIDDCRNMVDSWEEMLFIYNIKEDKLYFSPKACRAMGWQSEVRRYWKESENFEFSAVWADRAKLDMAAVKGKLIKI